jgi:hypothetical protein
MFRMGVRVVNLTPNFDLGELSTKVKFISFSNSNERS